MAGVAQQSSTARLEVKIEEGSRAEGFYVYYWYVIVSVAKESPNLYRESYKIFRFLLREAFNSLKSFVLLN
jgi:hypothetical protein